MSYSTFNFQSSPVRLIILTALISPVRHCHGRLRTVRPAQYVHFVTWPFSTQPLAPLQAYSPTMSCSHPTTLVPSSLPTCGPLLSDSHRVTSFAASPLLVCSPCRQAGGGPNAQTMMPGRRRRSACLAMAVVRRRAASRNRIHLHGVKSLQDPQQLQHEARGIDTWVIPVSP